MNEEQEQTHLTSSSNSIQSPFQIFSLFKMMYSKGILLDDLTVSYYII